MPARRQSLKLLPSAVVAAITTRNAELGGLGLRWVDIPGLLDDAGVTEWKRLAEVFAAEPVRFREADRAALTAYCAFWSAFHRAAAEVAGRGAVAEGRSAPDRGRLVKNPATVAMREASIQLRYWARELGLTPDARGRMGLPEPKSQDDADDPFAWHGAPP